MGELALEEDKKMLPSTVDQADEMGNLDQFLLDHQNEESFPALQLYQGSAERRKSGSQLNHSIATQDSWVLPRTKKSFLPAQGAALDYNKVKNERDKKDQKFREQLDQFLLENQDEEKPVPSFNYTLAHKQHQEQNTPISARQEEKEPEEPIEFMRVANTECTANLVNVINYLHTHESEESYKTVKPVVKKQKSIFSRKGISPKPSKQGLMCDVYRLPRMVTVNYDTPVLKVPRIDSLPRVVSHDRVHSVNNKSSSPSSRMFNSKRIDGRNLLQKIKKLESKSQADLERRAASRNKDSDEKKKKQSLNKNFILKNIEAVGTSLKSPKHMHKKSLSSSNLEEIRILNPETFEDASRLPLHQVQTFDAKSEMPSLIQRNYNNSNIKMQISPPMRYSPLKTEGSQHKDRPPQLPRVSKVGQYSPTQHPSVLLQKTIRAEFNKYLPPTRKSTIKDKNDSSRGKKESKDGSQGLDSFRKKRVHSKYSEPSIFQKSSLTPKMHKVELSSSSIRGAFNSPHERVKKESSMGRTVSNGDLDLKSYSRFNLKSKGVMSPLLSMKNITPYKKKQIKEIIRVHRVKE